MKFNLKKASFIEYLAIKFIITIRDLKECITRIKNFNLC